MFQERVNNNLIKNMAAHCRKDENLCGESGFLYESNRVELDNEKVQNYEYIKSVCSGNIVEDDYLTKLEQLELELVNVFQKMRRHNKKIIYNNVKNVYKLFKKKDSEA